MRSLVFAWSLLAVSNSAGLSAQSDSQIQFVDRAADWGLEFTYESGRSGEYLEPEIFGSGVALLDFDGDGDLDVYLAQGGRLTRDGVEARRDVLFRQDVFLDDGKVSRHFVEVGERAGLGTATDGYGMGVAVGDVDGDGVPDVFVTKFGPDRLWRNLGDGSFEDATEAWGLATPDLAGWSVPAVFFDAAEDGDSDGRLDLWVGRYLDYRVGADADCTSPAGAADYCGPLVYPALSDLLYRNDGNRFVEATDAAGMADAAGRALGGVALDADGDGTMDLYVANDMGENFLWRNEGQGTFVDEALLSGTALNRRGEAEGSMGVEAQDVDGDGDDDLFMTHTTLESNTFYENQLEQGSAWLFDDRSRESGLGAPSLGHTGFGTAFLDADLDGDLDAFVANGAVRALEALAREGDSFPYREPDQVFQHLGSNAEAGTFREVPNAGVERPDVARAAARGDLDGDGDEDLVVSHLEAPAEVFENVSREPTGTSWLGVRVVDGATRGDLVGRRVGLRRDSASTTWRRTRTDGGYGAAHDPRVVFGLGDAVATSLAVDVRGRAATLRWRGLEPGAYVVIPLSSGR